MKSISALEGASLAVEGELAASSRDQNAWNVPSTSRIAEQVVEAVVEGVRVALDVEEQVARRRRRSVASPRSGVELLARVRQQQLVVQAPLAAPFELDAGLLPDALEGVRAGALERAARSAARASPSAASVGRRRGPARARRCRAEIPATRLR